MGDVTVNGQALAPAHLRCVEGAPLDELLNPFWSQPSNLVKCLPEFASFVDVDLASLLRIRLSELLAYLICFDPLNEDSAFRGDVRCTVQAKVGCKREFIGVEQVGITVEFEIDGSAFPIDLERVWLVWKTGHGRAVVW